MLKKIIQTFLFFSFISLGALYYSCDDNINNSYPGETIYDTEPSWSPGGGSILYIGGMTVDDFGIYAVDVNGTNKRPISVPDNAGSPDWSPDGQWIVYSKGGHIFKKRVGDDSSPIQLTFTGNNFFPSWSSDGEWIAFDSNADSPNGMYFVWKMRIDGSERRRILHSPTVGEIRQPDWFPDGVRLAVIRYITGYSGRPEVAVIDTMGNSVAVLTNDDRFNRSPKVSNDGNYIVYEADGNGGLIYTIKTDGSELKQISTGGVNPCWSPDGSKIAYTNTAEDGRIWMMNKNGSSKRKVSY